MAHRASVNQAVQIGPEVTPGTPVAAAKILTAFDWTFGAKPKTKQFTGTGRKYPSASALLSEMSQGKVKGDGDFNQLVYLLASVFGKPATPALHGPSTTAYDWAFTPPIAGPASPQTYTVQNGDGIDAEQYAYLLFSGWGYSFSRTQELQVTGDWFSQTFTDGATMTASPVVVAKAPMTGAQANVYLDGTSSAIGTTQLTNPMNVGFAASGFYGQFWPINRANASFTSHIDLMPKNQIKIKLEADTSGIAIRGNYLEKGALCYVRVDVTGPMADAAHTIPFHMQHDMACFVSDVGDFGDTDGAYAVEYTLDIAEDSAWTANGQAQTVSFTNLLSAL